MPQGSFKIARGKGSVQLPLAIVAVLAVVLVLVGKAQSPLFNQIRADFSDWSRPVLEASRVPLDVSARWVSGLGDLFDVYAENLRLKSQVQRLRGWQTSALLLEQRIKRYQLLLNAVPDPQLRSVTAHVIGRATRPFLDSMILDAGSSNGVHAGEAVIAPSGLVGRIFVTGKRTSWVILLTDLNSRVPVRTVKGNVRAILAGDNTPTPLLDTVNDPAKLKAGDEVVTSGDGGLLPPDVPVGVVVKDGEVMRVVLLADPATSQDVAIVDYKRPVEPPPPADVDPLAAATLPGPGTAVSASGSGNMLTANQSLALKPQQPAPRPAHVTIPSAANQAPGVVPAGHRGLTR